MTRSIVLLGLPPEGSARHERMRHLLDALADAATARTGGGTPDRP